MVVVAIIALASSIVTLALPDPASTRLEREATRLVAILETARVQARWQGAPVRWVAGRPRQKGDATHEGAANAEDVDVHGCRITGVQ